MKKQQGFTLIELVMVIVILGILAATALPKFVDLEAEAEQAAVDGVAGALGSASAINYAGCAAHGHDATQTECTNVTNCTGFSALINGVTFGANEYVIGAAAVAGNGTEVTCTVVKDADGGNDVDVGETNATFVAIGAGN